MAWLVGELPHLSDVRSADYLAMADERPVTLCQKALGHRANMEHVEHLHTLPLALAHTATSARCIKLESDVDCVAE